MFWNIFQICCQAKNSDELTEKKFDTEISEYTVRNISLEEFLFNKLNNKLGLIVIYDSPNILFPFNNIKQNNIINKILDKYYVQIYKQLNEKFSLDLINKLNIKTINNQPVSDIVLIINICLNKSINQISYLYNNQITTPALKIFIINNRFKGIKFNPQPQESSNTVKINFKSENGRQINCIFYIHEKISKLYDYVKLNYNFFFSNQLYLQKFCIVLPCPYKVLNNMNNSLSNEHIKGNIVLLVQSIENETEI